MTERIKLTITEVKEVQTVGEKGAKKLSFKAKGQDNKELWYFSFKTSIFDHIKKDAAIDVEVELSERVYNEQTYVDRKVTQLYVDGQPVGGQKDGKGFFGRQSNPEERASIESQVAAKIGGELLVAKIITLESKLGAATLNWCLSKMNGFILSKVEGKVEVKVTPVATKPQTPPNAPESSTVAGEAQVSTQQPVKPDRDPKTITSFTDLYRACDKDFGMRSSKEVIKELGYNSQADITETPAECYIKIVGSRAH